MLDSTVRARMNKPLKNEAENILKEIGLNTTQAINLFYKKIVAVHGIPFDLKIPNENLKKSMLEVKNKKGKKHRDIKEMMKDLKS